MSSKSVTDPAAEKRAKIEAMKAKKAANDAARGGGPVGATASSTAGRGTKSPDSGVTGRLPSVSGSDSPDSSVTGRLSKNRF